MYVYVYVYSRLYLSNVLSLSLRVLLVQLATFRIQMRFDCHPSRRESRIKAKWDEAGTWLNGFVGSFHGTQLHKFQLWGLKLVPQHGGWVERGEGGDSSNVATLYAVCCACCCVSVGVCFYYTRLTCSTSLSLSLCLSLFSFLFHFARLFARLPAQEHPKTKFSLASAKSSELNVSIDSKRHCLNTHTHTQALCNKVSPTLNES